VDLIGLFRDVLAVQLDANVDLINEEMRPQVDQIAGASTLEQTVRRLEALEHERIVLFAGGSPRTVLEATIVQLKDPAVRVSA
jgi:DNA polymerase-3 subunit delta'